MLEGARRVAQGEIPYRDFHFVYTPGLLYILAPLLNLFGNLVIVERLIAVFFSVCGVFFIGYLIYQITKNYYTSFLSMCIYAVWGPAHINFFWPVMGIIPLLFLYLICIQKKSFFLSGALLSVIFLCKQNFGIALLISLFIFIVYMHYSKKRIIHLFLGIMSVFFPFILHLILTKSFFPFVADMYMYTFQQILLKHAFSVPFPTDSLGKSILYIFPGMLALCISMYISRVRKHASLLIVPLTFLFFYLFGIFPTPDWTHLTPLLSITGVLCALIPILLGARFKVMTYFCMIIFVCSGIYSVGIRNYYRWEAPLVQHTHCFSSGKLIHMCIDKKNYEVLSHTLATIRQESQGNSYIFAFYNNPIYYFLTQKNNPTPYIDFNLPVGRKGEEDVVIALESKKVQTIVTRFSLHNSKSNRIVDYIEKRYVPVDTRYEFIVWKKK